MFCGEAVCACAVCCFSAQVAAVLEKTPGLRLLNDRWWSHCRAHVEGGGRDTDLLLSLFLSAFDVSDWDTEWWDGITESDLLLALFFFFFFYEPYKNLKSQEHKKHSRFDLSNI